MNCLCRLCSKCPSTDGSCYMATPINMVYVLLAVLQSDPHQVGSCLSKALYSLFENEVLLHSLVLGAAPALAHVANTAAKQAECVSSVTQSAVGALNVVISRAFCCTLIQQLTVDGGHNSVVTPKSRLNSNISVSSSTA